MADSPNGPSKIIQPGGAGIIPGMRRTAQLSFMGFTAFLFAKVKRAEPRRPVFLMLVDEHGAPVDVALQLHPGSLVAVIPPETADKIRATLPPDFPEV